jgi:hypothetical protein
MVAALADSKICPVLRGNKQPGPVIWSVIVECFAGSVKICNWFCRRKGFFDYLCYFVPPGETNNSVNTVGLAEQISSQSLGQAAGNDYLFYAAAGLAANSVSYCLEGFGFGWCNKTAGINDNSISVVWVGCYDNTGLCDFSQHSFAIDGIFGTAKRYKADRCGFFAGFLSHS